MVAEPTGNVNKESKIIKRKQMEILELKSTIDEIKISLEGFNNRSEQAEKKISEPEDKATWTIQYEQKEWGKMNTL